MANKYIKEVEGGKVTTLSDTDAFELDTGTESNYIEASDLATEILKRTADLTEDESPTLATTFLPAVDGSGNPIKVAADNIGGGGMTISTASVTTSNVTGVVGTLHNLDISGMTANRDWSLPTPTAVDELCGVRISVGDATYALIIKRNGVEFARSFITDEILVFQSTGTGAADWALIQNGLISAKALMKRAAAQSIASGGSGYQVEFDTASVNVGDMCNITASNWSVTIRRAGMYKVLLNGGLLAGFDDTETAQVSLTVNGTTVDYGAEYSPAAGKGLTPILIKDYVFAVGDVLKMYIFHNEGASVSTDTTSYPIMSVVEQG